MIIHKTINEKNDDYFIVDYKQWYITCVNNNGYDKQRLMNGIYNENKDDCFVNSIHQLESPPRRVGCLLLHSGDVFVAPHGLGSGAAG